MSAAALCTQCGRRVEIATGDTGFCPVCSSPLIHDVSEPSEQGLDQEVQVQTGTTG